MDNAIFSLDPNYSTTRLVSTILPQIEDNPEAKFQTRLFLPEGEARQGEGGLRTKGYYKHSYEVIDGEWFITDNFGVREEDTQRIPVDQEQVPENLLENVQKELRQADETDAEASEQDCSGGHIKLPLISVITVVFNGEKYLNETINSVLNQGYPNVEYIIVDGCSTDNTLDIVKSYEDQIDYWVSEKDSGIYDALNKGIICSIGDMIGILNADDFYYNQCLSYVSKYSINYPYKNFIFGTVLKRRLISRFKPWKIIYSFCFYTSHSVGFFILKVSQKKIGLYNLKYSCSADYDFFYRMIVQEKMKGIKTKKSEIFGYFRLNGFSSKVPYFEHLVEQTQIRLDNKQNRLLVLSIFILRYVKNIKKI